ncbi:hypothetical protein GCM10009813_13430 [Brevibacterium marinum]
MQAVVDMAISTATAPARGLRRVHVTDDGADVRFGANRVVNIAFDASSQQDTLSTFLANMR